MANVIEKINQHEQDIADFVEQLPDTDITISGTQATNELRINGRKLDLNKSLKVRNHSPTGFNWGYGGSGPAQSALAILLEYTTPYLASLFYQQFKFGWIGSLPQTDFSETVNLRQVMIKILFYD